MDLNEKLEKPAKQGETSTENESVQNQAISINISNNPHPPPYFQPLPQLHPNYGQSALNTTTFNLIQLGSNPTRLRCPNCSADILTDIKFKPGCMTWAITGSICAVGLFIPCAWLGCQFIPFCINSCKDVQHSCSNCRNYIGTFDRMK